TLLNGELVPNTVTLKTGSFLAQLFDSPFDDTITTAAPSASAGLLALPERGTAVVLSGGNDKVYAAAGTTIQKFGGGDNEVNQVLDPATAQRVTGALQNAGSFAGNQAFTDLLRSQSFTDLYTSQAFTDLLRTGAFTDLLRNQAFTDLLKSQAF